MEDVKTVIIPTRTKEKISHELSFPIGAERISIALASAPQLPELVLHFRSDRWYQVRLGHYPILSVRYSGKNWAYNPVTFSGIPLFNKWEIEVNPVPRPFRHRIQQYILESALPQIRQWLDQRADLAHEGTDTFGFFFDEGKEEFVPNLLARPQPLRRIKQKD
jgi:hypothetical protein